MVLCSYFIGHLFVWNRCARTTMKRGRLTARCTANAASASTTRSCAAARSTTTCRSTTTAPAARCPYVPTHSHCISPQVESRPNQLVVQLLLNNQLLAILNSRTCSYFTSLISSGVHGERDVGLPAAHARLAVQHYEGHGGAPRADSALPADGARGGVQPHAPLDQRRHLEVVRPRRTRQ